MGEPSDLSPAVQKFGEAASSMVAAFAKLGATLAKMDADVRDAIAHASVEQLDQLGEVPPPYDQAIAARREELAAEATP